MLIYCFSFGNNIKNFESGEVMKLSVAMTTFNGERFIKKQLESLKNQTRQPDEVVIFDDGSIDDTVNIVKRFIKKHQLTGWRLFASGDNVGFKRNFCRAVSKTTGDIIFLCDQDDVWKPYKLEVMSKLMEKHPEILALGTAVELIDASGRKLPESKTMCNRIGAEIIGSAPVKLIAPQIAGGNLFPGCTMAFSSKIKGIYLEEAPCMLCHDYLINIIAALKNGLYYINIALTQYRIHSGNVIGISGEGRRPLKSERINESVQIVRLIRKHTKSLRGDSELLKMLILHLARAGLLKKFSIKKLLFLSRQACEARRYYPSSRFLADICYGMGLERIF